MRLGYPIAYSSFFIALVGLIAFSNISPDVHSADYSFIHSWGTFGKEHGQFNHPSDIAIDKSNNSLYVVDINNYRIQKFTENGKFLGSWGSRGVGNGQFDKPGDIAVDVNAVYVSDIKNDRIQKFDSNGNFLSSWGSKGIGNGQFNHPGAIALDSTSQRLYIVDVHNNRVQVFTTDGEYVSSWGKLGTTQGLLYRPAGIGYDPVIKRVYVADSGNDRIQVFDTSGKFLFTWGSTGTGNGQFLRPTDIGIDSNKNLIYVTDSNNERVQVFDTSGKFLFRWGNKGSGNGQFIEPTGIVVDSGRNVVYVSDKVGNKIDVFKVILDGIAGRDYTAATKTLNGTDFLEYSNPTTAISLYYPAKWKVNESNDRLIATFRPFDNTTADKQESFQVKTIKIPSTNFSLSKYLSTYIRLLQESPQILSINESQNINILGHKGFQIFYNKQIDNSEYSVIQALTNKENLLYAFSFTIPKEQYTNDSSIIKKVIQSVKPYTNQVADKKFISGFKTYENQDHKVKIQYPSNWKKEDEYSNSIVRFIAPNTGGVTKPTGVLVSIFQRPTDSSLNDFIDFFHNRRYSEQSEFTVVNSSDSILGGLKAREIILYEQRENVVDPASDLKVMRVYAFDSNSHKGYTIRYYSEPGLFNKYLPTVQKMIESFEIEAVPTLTNDVLRSDIEKNTDSSANFTVENQTIHDNKANGKINPDTISAKMEFELEKNELVEEFAFYDLIDYSFFVGDNSRICPEQNCKFELEETNLTPTLPDYGVSGTMKVDKGDVKKILGIYSSFKPTEEREENDQMIEVVEGTFGVGKEPVNEAEFTYNINGTLVTAGNFKTLSLQGVQCNSLQDDQSKGTDCNY